MLLIFCFTIYGVINYMYKYQNYNKFMDTCYVHLLFSSPTSQLMLLNFLDHRFIELQIRIIYSSEKIFNSPDIEIDSYNDSVQNKRQCILHGMTSMKVIRDNYQEVK